MSNEGLVKVHVSLPNHWMIAGESMWAQSLGNNVYKLENVPFFSYGLNFKDEVEAYPDKDDILEVSKVVKPSGNKTIRIVFDKTVERKSQDNYINTIKELDCSLERWDDTYLSVNIREGANFDAIYDQLDEWSEEDILGFETCHERVEGSFDDILDEEA